MMRVVIDRRLDREFAVLAFTVLVEKVHPLKNCSMLSKSDDLS